jgi:hypothetical protein
VVSTASWWASKVRQFRSHVRARVRSEERAGLADWLTAEQLALFDSMHIADRRHGLDVVATLRNEGVADDDLLVAGLLHDAGKGPTGVWPRVAYALGRAYGSWVWRLAAVVPRWRPELDRLRDHAEASARLADEAGCSPRTVELIRHQDAPVDPDAGRALQLADEAN